MQEANYKIYNASAGSGKTYTLTKAYLKIILSTSSNTSFRNILAITFTNKAVNEMKSRILDSLFTFGTLKQATELPQMFADIAKELSISSDALQKKSKLALKYILHNYAFFDISTIDKFTHRLIRTFAKDLKLPQNFEVVLDTDLLLDEAISKLIYKVGENKELTKVLLDFALEKIEDDKSWDIVFDLTKTGKLLFQENNIPHLKGLENKNIVDFLALQKKMQQEIKAIETDILIKAKNALNIITEEGFENTDFTRETLPNHFKKINAGEFTTSLLYNNKLEENLIDNKILLAKVSKTSETLAPRLLQEYIGVKKNIYQRAQLKNIYQNIVPLTVLNAIQKEIKTLEQEQDLLPISSFNRLIASEIKNQQAPFIYERLGEKYRHYFIDEFQDTSTMQWTNLLPLISNALESLDDQGQKGSLTLVGDAKQAIYRWRGGEAEQFLNLSDGLTNPFVINPAIKPLPANYRSYTEIINFNNDFFTKTSEFITNETYNALFINGNQQEVNTKKGGLVSLHFIDSSTKKEEKSEDHQYCEQVLETIHGIISKNYSLKDICILTRKKKHGILLANFLMQHEIPIISSETLLLKNSHEVRFLINLLRYCADTTDLETSYQLLAFLARDKKEKHQFIKENLKNLSLFLDKEYGFSLDTLRHSSAYDGLEIAIKTFSLTTKSDAYLTFLLDTVLDTEQKEGGNLQVFLNYWGKKQDSLSITAPENIDAVQIMTIHKSKGLEFPFVIFPFANTNIYEEIEPKLWLPLDQEKFNGFGEVLISKKKEVIDYNEIAKELFETEEQKLELDAFNLLYVVLTRAVKGLFVITKKDLTTKGDYKPNYYSGLFIHYLSVLQLWDADKPSYLFGILNEHIETEKISNVTEEIPHQYTFKDRPSFKVLTKSGVLWDTEREDAIKQGNLLHHIMEKIETKDDIIPVFKILLSQGELTPEAAQVLKSKVLKIVSHPKLESFYLQGSIIKNESDIITKNGLILRPDRIVIQDKLATLLDYKTGKKNPKYHEQLYTYADALIDMGYTVQNKIIIYVNDDVVTEFI